MQGYVAEEWRAQQGLKTMGWDKDQDGSVLGEASGVLLEPETYFSLVFYYQRHS